MENCLTCGKGKNVLIYSVRNRGFGSRFDGYCFQLPICRTCETKWGVKEAWFEQQNQPDKLTYEFEEELENFLTLIPEPLRQQVVGTSRYDRVAQRLFD